LTAELRATAERALEVRRNQRQLQKFGAKTADTLHVVEALIDDIIGKAVAEAEALQVSYFFNLVFGRKSFRTNFYPRFMEIIWK
jgi:hypothetical protein